MIFEYSKRVSPDKFTGQLHMHAKVETGGSMNNIFMLFEAGIKGHNFEQATHTATCHLEKIQNRQRSGLRPPVPASFSSHVFIHQL
jgi:hypothetical protein